jgi:RNA polymerase sigma factor (sigma-70 family)
LSEHAATSQVEAHERLLAELAWLERACSALARHHALDPDETDDFTSWVRARLFEGDCAIIRKHRGEASLRSYLGTVIARLFLDYRTQRWGRWRPSAEARRSGPLAVRLERMIVRDGHSLGEAMQILKSAGEPTPVRDIQRLAAGLPLRSNPRKHIRAVPEETVSTAQADDDLNEAERRKAFEFAAGALRRALSELPGEDQIVLNLLFREGMKISDIARALSLEQRLLYRRIEGLKGRLGERLRADGIDAQYVRDLLADR